MMHADSATETRLTKRSEGISLRGCQFPVCGKHTRPSWCRDLHARPHILHQSPATNAPSNHRNNHNALVATCPYWSKPHAPHYPALLPEATATKLLPNHESAPLPPACRNSACAKSECPLSVNFANSAASCSSPRPSTAFDKNDSGPTDSRSLNASTALGIGLERGRGVDPFPFLDFGDLARFHWTFKLAVPIVDVRIGYFRRVCDGRWEVGVNQIRIGSDASDVVGSFRFREGEGASKIVHI